MGDLLEKLCNCNAQDVQDLIEECQVFHDRCFMRLKLMAERQSVVDLQTIGNDFETRMRQVLDEREMPEELRNLL